VFFVVVVAFVFFVKFVVADELLQGLENLLLRCFSVLVVDDFLLALGFHEVAGEKLAFLGWNAESVKAALKRNDCDLLLRHEWLEEERHDIAWLKMLLLKPELEQGTDVEQLLGIYLFNL